MGDLDQRQFESDDEPTPDRRTYIHERCRTATVVSGGDFGHICNPFIPCSGTHCCGCGRAFSLSSFRWRDTGEVISEYHSRLLWKSPLPLLIWCLGGGALLGLGAGALVGQLIHAALNGLPKNHMSAIVIGGIVGLILFHAIGLIILKGIYNIDYRRMK